MVKVEPGDPADQTGGSLGDILVGFGMAHVRARLELFIYAHEENAQPVSD